MNKPKKRKRERSSNYKLYAVAKGRVTGLFINWLICQESTNGFKGASHKGFNKLGEAKKFLIESGTPITFNGFTEAEVEDKSSDKASVSNSVISSVSGEELEKLMDTEINSISDSEDHTNNKKTSCSDQCHGCESLQAELNNTKMRLIAIENSYDKLAKLVEDSAKLNIELQQKFDSFMTNISDNMNPKQLLKQELERVSNNITNQLKTSLECVINTSTHKDTMSNNHSPTMLWSKLNHSTFNQASTSTAPLKNNIKRQPTSRSKESNDFRAEDNLVIEIKKDSTTYANFNQDNIRRDLNQAFGSIIIEKVNKYKFGSDKPRIMIQLRDKTVKKNMVENWKPMLFGGSSVRETIDPKSLVANSGMLKGVPIDADDDTLRTDICALFPGVTAERIFFKDGKPMRMFKIRFNNVNDFGNALRHGICLKSQGIKCHFEKLR